MTDDPILARRARVARLADLGQKIGYGLLGLAVALFVVGAVVGCDAALVVGVVASLAVGSVVLLPAIVFGFAVKAAEREDRDAGRAGHPGRPARPKR